MDFTDFLIKYYYRHPKPFDIFLPTSKYSRAEKLAGVKKVAHLHHHKLDRIYRPLLKNLREQYRGQQRCFIIGNGPSLNNMDLSKLNGEITFGVNSIFLKFAELEFRPTFYVVEDHLVAEDRAEQINAVSGMIKLFPVYLAYCLNEGPDTVYFNHMPRKSYPHGFDFSTDASEITYAGGTVTYTCMQLAYYLGIRDIYLIGVDHNYQVPDSVTKKKDYNVDILDMQEDDPNHFSPDYFGKGYRWHDPRTDVMEAAYREAKTVTQAHNVRIRNATAGGQLEVFERVDYDSLFADDRPLQQKRVAEMVNLPVLLPVAGVQGNQSAATASARAQHDAKQPVLPRVLVVSNTLMKFDTATGALVKKLFEGWPKGKLAQLYTGPLQLEDHEVCDRYFHLSRKAYNYQKVMREVTAFAPELIYIKLTPDPKVLLEFIIDYAGSSAVPIITHIMDDWPEQVKNERADHYLDILPLLTRLLSTATLNLSISDKMSRAYLQRYGIPFQAISNFVDDAEWQAPADPAQLKQPQRFTIRYSGSLASDMQLDSLIDVARAVEEVAKRIPVRFEIFMHPRWRGNAEAFNDFHATHILPFVDYRDYHALLQQADVLLIAANFDYRSLNYIRYSVANKLPEYLASGTPLLVYGPEDSATVAMARDGDCACLVTNRDPQALQAAIQSLYEQPELRQDLSLKARHYVFEKRSKARVLAEFRSMLNQSACTQLENRPDTDWLIGEYSNSERMNFDERQLLERLLHTSSAKPASLPHQGDRHTLESVWLDAEVKDLNELMDMMHAARLPSCISVRCGSDSVNQLRDLQSLLQQNGYVSLISRWHDNGTDERNCWQGLAYAGQDNTYQGRVVMLAFRSDPEWYKLFSIAAELVVARDKTLPMPIRVIKKWSFQLQKELQDFYW